MAIQVSLGVYIRPVDTRQVGARRLLLDASRVPRFGYLILFPGLRAGEHVTCAPRGDAQSLWRTDGHRAGVVSSTIIARTLSGPLSIPPQAILLAPLFAIAVGIFFGFYPARRASRLDPIEALRYE